MAGIIINGTTKLFGIVGNPVKHSFSPGMHSRAFQETGINAVYLPFPIHEKQLPRLLDAFDLTGVQGFNVTIPFKEKIVPFLDEILEEAAVLGSVNTVVRTDSGWKGYSTDGSGFIRSLEAADISLVRKKATIIGAGGAAKSIALSLVNSGISKLTIANRTSSKAKLLVQLLQQVSPGFPIDFSETIAPCDLLINATSVGMEDNDSPVPREKLKDCGMVVDIIYNPAQTTLLKQAAELSIPFMNGLDMLLYQGVEAFEIWTGQPAPVDAMRHSLISSLYSASTVSENRI